MSGCSVIITFAAIAPSLCQYAVQSGLRPDVTFGEENDRFDVSSLIRRQKHHSRGNFDPQSEEYRRKNKQRHKNLPWPNLLKSNKGRNVLKQRIKGKLEDHVNNLANTIITKIRSMRRNDEEFAYHDNMNSEYGDTEDFNDGLKSFDNVNDLKENRADEPLRRQIRLQNIVNKLHGTNETRRMSPDPEKEILLHYAFPVDMKIEGFLQAPLN